MNIQPDIINQRGGRRYRYTAALWVLLALIVITLCMLNYHAAKKMSSAGMNTDPDVQGASTQMILVGRYCIGAKSIYSDFPGMEADLLSANMLIQVKSSVRLESDRVCLIPFIAEFSGRDEVFRYISALRDSADLPPALNADLDQFEKLYQLGASALSENVHHRLLQRYRWVAEMAMTFGLPSDHPDRLLAINPAKRTFFAAFIVMGFVFIGGLVGLGLFITSIVMFSKKRLRAAFVVKPTGTMLNPHVFLETTVVCLAMVLLMSLIGGYLPRLVFWFFYLLIIMMAVSWPVLRGVEFGPTRRALGWYRGRGVIREATAGLLGYLAGLPLVGGGCFITFWIIKKTGANPVHPIIHQFDDAAMLSVIGLVALASIMAPILEETLFRGAFYRYLRFKLAAPLSALISGLIFAVIHPQGFAAVPVLGAIGMVFAVLREWRGSLIAPLVAHSLNNLLITLLLVFALMN